MRDAILDFRHKKRTLAKEATCQKLDQSLRANFCIHGLNASFGYDSLEMKNWIEGILKSYNVLEIESDSKLKTDFLVTWQTPVGFSESETKSWNEDPDPNLEIFKIEKKEVAVQRDFMGIINPDNQISVYLQRDISDGFYNALRWFLPRYLLQKNAVMMHSSCLVGEDKKAYLFLGPSGVGKTTTVSRTQGQLILGDDMILISIAEGKAFAETPILGQNPKFKGQAGSKYPIAGFHFLEQSDVLQKTRLDDLTALRHFLMSLMYPTWNYVSENDTSKLTELAKNFLQLAPGWKLQLDLNTSFLGVIYGSHR